MKFFKATWKKKLSLQFSKISITHRPYHQMNWAIIKYELGYNHPQLPTTTHNHPQQPTTTQKSFRNHPQAPTTIYNHPQPPTITQKLPKKAKTCDTQLFYCTLDVNTETDVDFDSDMKQWYIYRCVCLCVNAL